MERITRIAWEFQYSVDCGAPRQFAWDHWTNVANWNDPPASFHLDGPFAAGSEITTSLPGQQLHSVIREVVPGHQATIEMLLPDAILSFHWKFETLTENASRITQRMVLSGPNAAALVDQARILERTTPEGMKKLVLTIYGKTGGT
jgi:hypothetical protein